MLFLQGIRASRIAYAGVHTSHREYASCVTNRIYMLMLHATARVILVARTHALVPCFAADAYERDCGNPAIRPGTIPVLSITAN